MISYKAYVWDECTSYNYASAYDKVEVIIQGQGQILEKSKL